MDGHCPVFYVRDKGQKRVARRKETCWMMLRTARTSAMTNEQGKRRKRTKRKEDKEKGGQGQKRTRTKEDKDNKQ